MTANDAKYVLTGFGILIPIIIAWMPTIKISDYYKFAILALLSIVGGYLTILATDQLVTGGTIIQNGALILSASQIFYYTAFRVLGLERVLFPRQALATHVKEQAKESTPTVSSQEAKDILDPTADSSITVSTKIA